MRSRANFKTHPIHPMLIPFPIAFIVGAFAFDLAGLLGGGTAWWTTGGFLNIGALITGPLAGLFGFIDYLYTVPPRSSAKKRATNHGVINVAALAVLGSAWFFRDGSTWEPGWAAVGLETAAVGLVMWGGWLGGTLSFRNQIGVDHRYANAGKWAEISVDPKPGQAVTVAKSDELEVDQMKLIRLPDGKRLVLARAESGYAVFDDRCPHKGGSLAGGLMTCGTVTCPWHGSQFSVTDGAVKAGPAHSPIGTYRVEQSDGEVRLML
ncbi:DUF2231 domain-containing protein [Tautonia sp. JC769]|uniref:DUF2231 domain-containing protein n=1 Tax=Tautonia sp. JC769 TaxID=3232135 RepID=UPI00345A08FF